MKLARLSAALVMGALLTTSASFAAMFYNGSFELGASISGQFSTLSAGNNTSITGWTVVGSGVDYISGYWTSAAGSRSVDLSATGPGGVAQTFDTVAGTLYEVSYAISGNPVQGLTTPKAYLVQVDGTTWVTSSYAFETGGLDANSVTNMNWDTRSFQFTATGAATTLTFLSNATGPCGPALDNVTVMAIPEPSTYAMILGALTLGLVGWRRFRK